MTWPHADTPAQPYVERRGVQQGCALSYSRLLVSARRFPVSASWVRGRRDRRARARSRQRRGTSRPSLDPTTTRRGTDLDVTLPEGEANTGTPPEAAGGAVPLDRGARPADGEHRPTYSAGMLRVHRSDRTDALVSMLARVGGRTARRPDDAGGRLRADQGHRAVAEPAPLRPAGRHARSARRGVRQHRLPLSRDTRLHRSGPGHRQRPQSRPVVAQRAVWPLMEVVEEHFDEPWLTPLADHIRNSGVTEEEALPGRPKGRSASPSSGTWRTSSTATRAPSRHASALGGRGAGTRRGGLAVRAVAAARRTHRPSEPRRAPGERLPPAPGRVRPPRPPSTVLVVRVDAAARELPGRPRRRRLSSATSISSSSTRPPSSGAAWKRKWARAPGICHVGRTRRCRQPHNPLLASWGRDAREMQLVLGGAETHTEVVEQRNARASPPCSSGSKRTSGPIDCRGRSEATTPARCWRATTTASACIPAMAAVARSRCCRDAILHRLAEDSDLEPRDIIVMCPDIEHFAPLIQATFGAHDDEGGQSDGTRQLKIRLGRPLAPPDQPGNGCPRRGARACHRAHDGEPGARPGRARARTAAVPLCRRGPGAPGAVGARGECALGLRRDPPTDLQTRTRRGEHLAIRAGPGPARCGDGGGRPAALRGDASAGRRRERRHRAGRASGRIRRALAHRHRARSRATAPCANGRWSSLPSPIR